MKFVISIDDVKLAAFSQRAVEAFGEEQAFTRIQITEDNLPTAVPAWFQGAKNRWAVTQALLQALKQAQSAGEDCELYEEDCVFAADFASKRAAVLAGAPSDWDMIYLGGQLLALNFYPLKEIEGNDTVLLCRNAHRNHAWICRKESIPRVTEWLETPGWPCTHTCDWRLGYLHMQEDFHVYIPKTGWICGQGAGMSSLDCQEYPERWWHFTEPEKTQEEENTRVFFQNKEAAAEQKRFEEWKAAHNLK